MAESAATVDSLFQPFRITCVIRLLPAVQCSSLVDEWDNVKWIKSATSSLFFLVVGLSTIFCRHCDKSHSCWSACGTTFGNQIILFHQYSVCDVMVGPPNAIFNSHTSADRVDVSTKKFYCSCVSTKSRCDYWTLSVIIIKTLRGSFCCIIFFLIWWSVDEKVFPWMVTINCIRFDIVNDW